MRLEASQRPEDEAAGGGEGRVVESAEGREPSVQRMNACTRSWWPASATNREASWRKASLRGEDMDAQNLQTSEEHTTSQDKLQECAMSKGRRTGTFLRLRSKPQTVKRRGWTALRTSHQREQVTKNETEATAGEARAGTKRGHGETRQAETMHTSDVGGVSSLSE